MHAWMEDVDMVQLAATLAILGIIAVTIIKSWRPVRAVVRFLDAMIGGEERDRDGHKLRPGILDRMASLEQQVAEIHHETHRNDGSSIKDSTVRLEAALRRVEDTQHQILQSTAEDARHLAEHITEATDRDERISTLTRLVDRLRGTHDDTPGGA